MDFPDKPAVCRSQILKQFLVVGIELTGVLQRERHHHLGQELSRGRDGKFGLHAFTRKRIDKAEVVYERMILTKGHLTRKESVVYHGLLPVEGKAGFGRDMPHTVKSPHKVKMPCLAAEFTVGNYLETKFLLFGYKVPDGIVFNGLEFFRSDFSGSKANPGFLYRLRTEETADEIGTHSWLLYHRSIFSRACARSAMMSSICSVPMDRRTVL